MSRTSNSTSDQFDPQATQADQAMADAPDGPNRSAQATTWEFTTLDKQGRDPLRYTVTIRPIHEFGRRGKYYKGVMTHYERMLDSVLGVEGLEASVLVTSSFKQPSQQLGNSSLQYVQIFSNSARVYRAHDDSHDPVKATSAVLRKVLQTAGKRIRRDVFGVVFGSVETMKQVGMSHFYGKQPFPFFPFGGRRGEQTEPQIRYGTNWVQMEGPQADALIAKLMDLGLSVGIWKVK